MRFLSWTIYPLIPTLLVIAAIAISVWRTTAEPEFCSDQRVMVVGGFYRGTTGSCEALDDRPGWEFAYRVRLDSQEVIYIKESDLDPAPEAE